MESKDICSEVFCTCIEPLYDENLCRLAFGKLSEERKAKTERYLKTADKYLSAGAEILLKYALSKNGKAFSEIVLGENGKPYFKSNDIYFNISHSGEYVICAVSQDEIGCDIEKIGEADESIAKRFFSKKEFLDISSKTGNAEKADLFYRYWTLKESFLKATGTGMKAGFGTFTVNIGDEITVNDSFFGEKYFFKEFDAIKGYKCAVCSVADCENIKFTEVNIKNILSSA